jgi:hypothetical protein
MAFTLTIASGKGAGQRFQLEAGRVTIGRDAASDVVLDDAGISRHHARIERQAGAWLLADDGSANGTELNGRAVAFPQPLKPGDRVGVGPIVLRFGAAPQTRLSRRARIASLAMLVVAIPVWAMHGREPLQGLACPETIAVDDDTASYSFGHGEADVECGKRVAFGFNAPAQSRVLLHYQAEHLGSAGELELRVNGAHLGWAKVSSDEQVLPLPAEEGGRTVVTFTQSEKKKPWSVRKVRVETFALTQGTFKAASGAFERGRRKLDERRIAPRNLFDAWKSFTDARREMDGLAVRPLFEGELTQLIQDCERDLHKECGRLLFAAARFERYGQEEKAQQAYREVLLHFPGDDASGCRKKARESIAPLQAGAGQQ